MDTSVPMILPKGIVINTTNIYKEVASYPILPNDKVWEYWHVYTTTNKKLKDPTARRLENFWWHVWGSDRRYLSGRALARLYEDISMGPTFVPLRGPPNRWEGDDPPPMLLQAIDPSSHSQAFSPPPQNQEPEPSARIGLKSLSSSASKPPPAHPILKKARGPSSSGPRPTARFLSPHESADEDERDSDIPSSGSTATGTELKAGSASPAKKKQTSHSKKFVASSGSAKRRPLLPRRLSSQSSTGSESGAQGSSSGSRGATIQRAVSPIPEAASNHVTPDSGGSNRSLLQAPPGLSAKAVGKRPVLSRRALSDKRMAPRPQIRSPVSPVAKSRPEIPVAATAPAPARTSVPATISAPVLPPAPSPRRTELPQARSFVDLPLHSRKPSESTRPTIGATGLSWGSQGIEAPAAMARSQSHGGYDRYKTGQPPSPGLFTGATASTTNVAAQGTMIDQSGLNSMPTASVYDRQGDDYVLPSRPSASELLESRFMPTQPSTSASVPLGRTRSQLTLLLERENARMGNKPRSNR